MLTRGSPNAFKHARVTTENTSWEPNSHLHLESFPSVTTRGEDLFYLHHFNFFWARENRKTEEQSDNFKYVVTICKDFYKSTKTKGFWFLYFEQQYKNMMLVQKSDKVHAENYKIFIGRILLSIEHLLM